MSLDFYVGFLFGLYVELLFVSIYFAIVNQSGGKIIRNTEICKCESTPCRPPRFIISEETWAAYKNHASEVIKQKKDQR